MTKYFLYKNNNKMRNLKTNLIALITLLTVSLLSINSNAQLHVVKPNGSVGIGTETPQDVKFDEEYTEPIKLDVKGGNTILRGRETVVGSDAAGGMAQVSVGRGRIKNGRATVSLFPYVETDKVAATGWISAGTTKNSGKQYATFQGNVKDFLSIRSYQNTANILFQTPGKNAAEDGIAKLMIKPGGRVGIGTENPTALLHVHGTAAKPGGGDWVGISDRRAKKNINEYTKGLEEVLKINPVTFNYNGKAGISDTETTYVGIVAQEFAKIEPRAVTKHEHTDSISNKTEEFMGIDASSIRYMLVNAIKEQQAKIESLEEKIEKMAVNGTSAINPTANEISVLIEGNGTESALLAQNIPNPFKTSTRIEYFVPANSRNARMSFRDMTGKEIKRVDIANDGIGAIELTAKDLAAGIYSYVLYVNGSIVDSKKMVIQQQ